MIKELNICKISKICMDFGRIFDINLQSYIFFVLSVIGWAELPDIRKIYNNLIFCINSICLLIIVVLFIRSCFSEDNVRLYRLAVGLTISDIFSHYIIINNYLNLFTLALICAGTVCI
uniref:Uncharacterized protein n=1 Tax=Strigamia maritima TaxID=126957 RepID=T1JKL1_STRMM